MLLAIDPGLQGTGLALWRHPAPDQAPVAIMVLTHRTKDAWWERAQALTDRTHAWVRVKGRRALTASDMVVCEFPEYQESAHRALAWRNGDMQRMTFLVGMLAQVVRPAQFVPVMPRTWKGQLPKNIVTERIIERLGAPECAKLRITTHAWDAVGIGLWALDNGAGVEAQWASK